MNNETNSINCGFLFSIAIAGGNVGNGDDGVSNSPVAGDGAGGGAGGERYRLQVAVMRFSQAIFIAFANRWRAI